MSERFVFSLNLSDQCTVTRSYLFLHKFWFFNTIYYFGNWAFIGVSAGGSWNVIVLILVDGWWSDEKQCSTFLLSNKQFTPNCNKKIFHLVQKLFFSGSVETHNLISVHIKATGKWFSNTATQLISVIVFLGDHDVFHQWNCPHEALHYMPCFLFVGFSPWFGGVLLQREEVRDRRRGGTWRLRHKWWWICALKISIRVVGLVSCSFKGLESTDSSANKWWILFMVF